MLKFTFKRGGEHIPEHKDLSRHQPITDLPLPETLYVALNQHLGKPGKILVQSKQEIKAGDLLAEADGFMSANIHSPVSGVVKKIENRLGAGGSNSATVVIETNAEATARDLKKFETRVIDSIDQLSAIELLEKIRLAGIVGAGGAAFPMHVKLSPPAGKVIDTFIVNGAECEPYLTSDHQLMLEATEEILQGIEIVRKILPVKQVYIGIEENKADAVEKFRALIREKKMTGIEVCALKTRYPQGGEKQLIEAITGREIPSGKLPYEIGIVVQNVGTLFNTYEAVFFNKPYIERVVSVTGFVKKPANFRLKIGTPFAHAIAAAGDFIAADQVREVINGGPMMGKACRDLEVAVMKGSSGIVVLSDREFHYHDEGPCIRCSRCIDICPMGLMPTDLANAAIFKNNSGLADAMDCIECGCCSYTCPTHRKLVHWIRVGKKIMRESQRSQK